jgi:hypothetical protein
MNDLRGGKLARVKREPNGSRKENIIFGTRKGKKNSS